MFWSADLRIDTDAPVLLIDADLDPVVARRFLPHMAEPVVINARLQAYHATQIKDRRVGKSMLVESGAAGEAENQRRRNHLAELRRLVEVEAARAPTLVITYEKAEQAMQAAGDIPGASFTHWNALRGRDEWKDIGTLIIAGTPEPGDTDLVQMARALFYLDRQPIQRGPYATTQRPIRLADGSGVSVPVHTHPDPRCTALLDQIRAEILQAVGRARLVWRAPETPCRILLLTNYPVPIRVHAVTTWTEAMPDPADLLLARGIVPDTWPDMAAVLSDLFGTAKDPAGAIRCWVRDNPEPGRRLMNVCETPIESTYRGFTHIRYRVAGRRKGGAAWVDLARHPDPRAALEAILGPLDRFELAPAAAQPPANVSETPIRQPAAADVEDPFPGDLPKTNVVALDPFALPILPARPPLPPARPAPPADPASLLPPRLEDDTLFTWSVAAMDALLAAGVPYPRASALVQRAWSTITAPPVVPREVGATRRSAVSGAAGGLTAGMWGERI